MLGWNSARHPVGRGWPAQHRPDRRDDDEYGQGGRPPKLAGSYFSCAIVMGFAMRFRFAEGASTAKMLRRLNKRLIEKWRETI